MKLRRTLLATALLAALASASTAKDALPSTAAQPEVISLSQALQNFATAPAAPVAAPDSSPDSDGKSLRVAGSAFADWRNTQSQLSNLQSYFDNNDYANALRQARQYARQAATPEVRQRWTDLIAALEAEQKKAESTLAAKIDAALARAATAALAATKPSELDPALDELAALEENRSGSTPRIQRLYSRINNAQNFLTQWQDMLAAYEAGDTESARQTLRNLSSSSYRDRPLTRSQILAFAASLKLDSADIAAAMARIDPVISRASATALAAKKSAELDPVLAELDLLKSDYENNYNTPLRRAYDRMDNAVSFFRQWQDFLAAYESGDAKDANQQLRNLASNTYRYRPIPRAQILERAAALRSELGTEVDTLLAGLTWQTLPAVRDRVSEAQEQAYGRQSTELSRIVAELDRLTSARASLTAGKAGFARAALRAAPAATGGCGSSASSAALPAPVNALREALWFEAMPALTGLADLPAREKDEPAADYVRRQLDAALAASDWARAYRFALLDRDLLPADVTPCGEREKLTGSHPAAALAAFLKAQKLEQAAQLPAAAEAYRESLNAGAPPALEPILITRLRALPATPVP
jgi:hypothetical protein